MIALALASIFAVLSLLTALIGAIVAGNMVIVAALVATVASWLAVFWLICGIADPVPPIVDDNHGDIQAERDARSFYHAGNLEP